MPDIVLCRIEDARWDELPLEPCAERAARATLSQLSLQPDQFEISLLGCDDTRIAALNAQFRDKPAATNVLSWPAEIRELAAPGLIPALPVDDGIGDPTELGDIAIAYETCRDEADSEGKSLADHATHLIVHGILHLLGYDHIRDADATLMEQLEVEILGRLGIDNPYREAQGS